MTSDFRDSTTLPDLRYVRELARVFKQYELGEIEIESGDQRILLRRGGGGEPVVAHGPAAATAPPVAALAPAVTPAPAAEPVVEATYITSPFVGTFYRVSVPGGRRPSSKVGADRLGRATVLCIVEAMKLLNELEAEVAGVIVESAAAPTGSRSSSATRLFRVRKLCA
jgi:acetyl-CoA carboxylase biotin carboxyl carrier protein